MGLQKQRAGAAGGVVNGLIALRGTAQADNFRHHARHFCRGVKLPLAFAAFGGKVAHQVLVGISKDVVSFGHVALEVELGLVEQSNHLGQPVDHVLAFAQLFRVVEVGHVNDAFQAVGFGKIADNFVDLVADLGVLFKGDHVREAAAIRHVQQGIRLATVLVRYVLDEQKNENVVLVLGSVHAAAHLIAGFPKSAVEFGFLNCHVS